MNLYGMDIALIDCTYNTTIYGFPLLNLCVSSNVGYINIATILLANETKEALMAGLQKVTAWNPGWKPKYFMSDFSEAQISALETVFPGLCRCIDN